MPARLNGVGIGRIAPDGFSSTRREDRSRSPIPDLEMIGLQPVTVNLRTAMPFSGTSIEAVFVPGLGGRIPESRALVQGADLCLPRRNHVKTTTFIAKGSSYPDIIADADDPFLF